MKKMNHLFKKGDIVTVKDNIDETINAFTATNSMRNLRGKKIKVTNVDWIVKQKCPCVYAGEWQWHPDDLYVIERKNHGHLAIDGPEGIFMFNPKNL